MNTLFQLFEGDWLPNIFAFLLGLSMLIYIVLDGYDLGVGILSRFASEKDRDRMVSSVAPFWDANETWLVLGSGLMLVAFPLANGVVFQNIYIPVALMLFGLIFRGISFDFRAKAEARKKPFWDGCFFAGSLLATVSQGYMLGMYMMGFRHTPDVILFSCLTGLFAIGAFTLVGSGWLIMKTEGALQKKAVGWGIKSLICCAAFSLVCLVLSPMLSESIYRRWFDFGMANFLIFPVIITILLVIALSSLLKLRKNAQKGSWVPFALTVLIFILNYVAIATTYYPWIVIDKMTLTDAAASRESLMIILVGALICLPLMIGYTIVVYKIFHGKAKDLSYE